MNRPTHVGPAPPPAAPALGVPAPAAPALGAPAPALAAPAPPPALAPGLELYSVNCKGIKKAASDLINNTAESLIRYIYIPLLKEQADVVWPEAIVRKGETTHRKHQKQGGESENLDAPDALDTDVPNEAMVSEAFQVPEGGYDSPEIRIGLSIRILVKSNCGFDEDLINLILRDIETLRHDTDYLLSFPDPKARREALDEEYALVQGYIDLDDTISLNQGPCSEFPMEGARSTPYAGTRTVPSNNMYQVADSGACSIQ